MRRITEWASLAIIFLGLLGAALNKIEARKQGKQNEGGRNLKGQEYKGTRNPEMDFVNGKGKSTLKKHAGKHGYVSPEEYLKDARSFLAVLKSNFIS